MEAFLAQGSGHYGPPVCQTSSELLIRPVVRVARRSSTLRVVILPTVEAALSSAAPATLQPLCPPRNNWCEAANLN